MIESYINEIIATKSMDKHTHTQKTFYTHQKKREREKKNEAIII